MGFFLQLRILLWKNLTLKRRTPLVLMLELFIPLVLFVILLCIRYKQPAYPMPDSHSLSKPLPSAGVLAVMQEFCSSKGQTTDALNFVDFPNSSVYQFLLNCQQIAENNNFFDPGFRPSEMDRIPELYHRIIDDPALVHDKFVQIQNLQLQHIVSNASELITELHRNFSLPSNGINAVLHSTFNLTELYRFLFGDSSSEVSSPYRKRRAAPANPASGWLSSFDNPLQNFPSTGDVLKFLPAGTYLPDGSKLLPEKLGSFGLPGSSGIIYDIIKDNPQLLMDPEIRRLVFGMVEAAGKNQLESYLAGCDPAQVARLLKLINISPSDLHKWLCTNNEYSRLLIPANETDASDILSVGDSVCNMSDSQLSSLMAVVSEHINLKDIGNQIDWQDVNMSLLVSRIQHFEDNLEQFLRFEKNLILLSTFASRLPRDLCTPEQKSQTVEAAIDHATNGSAARSVDGNSTLPNKPEGGDGANFDNGRNAGLIRIWIAMQNTLCGQSTVNEESISKSRNIDIDDLGLTESQRKNIGMLVHALYNNPKVLYAPNTTAASLVIQKANGTFVLLDVLSEYARKWLVVSADLREYLLQNSTEYNLQEILQMQQTLHNIPGLGRFIHSQVVRDFLSNPLDPSAVNRTVFLQQLEDVDNAACSWLSLVDGINVNVFQGFATEQDLVDYFLHRAYSDNVTVIASIVFKNLNADGTLPPHIIYKIRQNATFTATTKSVRDKYWHPGPGDTSDKYYHFGFVWLQDVIERAIISVQVGRDVLEPGTFIHQMPHPCYMEDTFLFMIEHVMPLCLTISWVYTVAMLVQSIVYEKEQRLKEVMRMMGLSNSVHWLAWFLTTFTQMSVTMAILTIMLKYGNVLMYSNAFITFLVLEIFTIATISFSFMVSVCYSKAKVAAACAGIVYFLSYVPYMYISIREEAAGDKISAFVKSLVSLFSTTAFGLGAKYFAFYEIEGVGMQWDNMSVSPVEDDQYNLQLVLLMMVFDSLLYGLLTWYIENVHPGSFGLPKPWYFPVTRSYWCGGHHVTDVKHQCRLVDCWKLCQKSAQLSVMEEDQACALEQPSGGSGCNFEAEPQHLLCGVHIDKLTKVFKTGKVAVNKLSLNLYESQITSFLGHNGAGKTTTMSILTGLFPPSDGHATIYNLDIRTDMEEIRKTLGMCPQHNVLFDQLTVEEHMWLYSRLKGMKAADISTEMDRMIEDLGLPKKRQSAVNCLSGGMKRKLSVAIAFVAGSRTVILDEPTAGVDPYARRAIWDLILKYRQGRTILLSTHHMDEADILGDRIAIISNGQLKCCGSSLFLKSTFGEGYHLTLVKKQSDEDLRSADTLSFDESRMSFHSHCSEEKITAFIGKHVRTAYLKAETNHELHYILPFEEAKKGGFEKLFEALDTSLDDLRVASYGIADTNLEEVFLKITENAQKADEQDAAGDDEDDDKVVDSVPLLSPVGSAAEASRRHHVTRELDVASLHSQLLPDGIDDVELNRFGASGSVGPSPVHSTTGSVASERIDLMLSTNPGCDMDTQLIDPSQRRSSDGNVSDYRFPSNVGTEDVELLDPVRQPAMCRHGETLPPPAPAAKSGVHDTRSLSSIHGHLLSGSSLYLQQFFAILVKRFYYIHRNWKSLFSQILLPALFVCVAMTVALTAPQVQDLPQMVLSPAQYYNYTQPRGNFIPTSAADFNRQPWSEDATADDIRSTFHLASGVAATCVLKSPFNSSFDADILRNMNYSSRSQQLLLEQYFESGCDSVFVKGIPMMNFVPPAPIVINSAKINSSRVDQQPVTANPNHPKYHPECTCTMDHTGQVCTTDGFDIPSSFQAVTAEYLQDITGDTEEDFYLMTRDMYRLHRYGGYSFGLVRDKVPETFGKNGPTQFRKLAVRHVSLIWYDNKGYHSMPVYLNALNNAILRANLPKEKGNKAAYVLLWFEKLYSPCRIDPIVILHKTRKQGSDVLIAIFVICAMSFVPASFVVFLVYERSVKAKHLQIVSGLDRVIYWLANYVWDMFNYLIPGTCCIIILKVFDIPAYVSSTNFPAVMTLFLLYGWSITPMMYPASFVFNEPSTAYIFLIVINLFIGITCIITSFLLELFQQNSKDLADIHDVLKNIFLIFPNYCLGRGLMDIAFNEYYNEFCFKMGAYSDMRSPFEWKLTARNMVAMTIMGFVFFFITLLCEFRFFMKPRHGKSTEAESLNAADEDVDVAVERRRVLRGSGRRDLLQLRNLSKVYVTRKMGRQLAVDRVCLGVPAGECFGLLGVNGAGKTTTFRMLTGDLLPSAGDAVLAGYSIVKDIFSVQRRIGYCPQFDALYDELTAREHLQLYSRLRGVPPREQKQVVDWALDKLDLTQYADRTSGTYSGGNKRKLSTAIALLGNPPVVFLDEPTTGMDPCSRRFLWNLILDLIHEGTSVILTSHSMEECEVLCSRLAVMVNGQLRCLGSTQHLKNRFGDGYTMLVRVRGSSSERDVQNIKRFISRRLPNAQFKECHHNIIQYEFPSADLSLSTIFSRMEEACRDLQIDDYSISQNTLDNVFINFVKQQQEIVRETSSSSPPVDSAFSLPLLTNRRQGYRNDRAAEAGGVEDEEEALLGASEDEANPGANWIDTQQVRLTFLNAGESLA